MFRKKENLVGVNLIYLKKKPQRGENQGGLTSL